MATAFGMPRSILRPSLKSLACLAVLILTVACSDSGTKGSFTPPPLIQPVEFSFITDGALFGFFESSDGEYSTQELLRPASGLMIILDTDQSRDASVSDTISYLRRSATPEYAVYAENDVLYAYELETQHAHTLFDFRGEKVSRPGSICDIQPVVSVDEDNFNNDRIVFVDMEAAFVRISYSDCSSTTAEDFAHYRVSFVEDDTREYAIRVEEPVDNEDNPTATRIVTKRYSELRGRRLPVDRALMYARAPVVDIAKDRVGYLGFNPDTLTWSFYVSDIDYSITRRIWQLTDSTFAAQSEQQSRGAFPDSTFTPETRQTNFMYLANNEIGLRYGNSIVKWTMDDVFDDDRSTERLNGLSNPIYTFINESIYEGEARPQSDGSWVIGDGPLIIVIAANGTAQTIKNLSHEAIDSYQLFTTRSEVGIVKVYTDGTYAATLISKAGGNETTIIGRTLNNVRLTPQSTNNDIHIATASLPSEQANIRARLHASGVEEIQPPLSNSMWTRKSSLMFREVPIDQIQLVSAETSITSAELNEPVLLDPVVYDYDDDASDGRGEPLAIIRDEVGLILRIWEYDENYGVALVSKSFSSDDSYKFYYYNPVDPEETEEGAEDSDDTTRAMVLMYDSENPPPRLN